MCECVCADGRTVRDAVLYSQERRQRSGIKALTDSPPSSVSGDVQRFRMKCCSGRPHYAVCAINAATGMAGVYRSGGLFVSVRVCLHGKECCVCFLCWAVVACTM